jgi:hypothetical protein
MIVTCLPEIVVKDFLDFDKNWGTVIPTDRNWALISITCELEDRIINDKQKRTLAETGCLDALPLEFYDVGDDWKTEENKFSHDQAKQIVEFVDKYKDLVTEFVIHCHAGISRSGAVGSFIVEYLKLDYQEFKKRNPNILPNAMVLRKLFEVSGIQEERVKFYNTLFEYSKDELDKFWKDYF